MFSKTNKLIIFHFEVMITNTNYNVPSKDLFIFILYFFPDLLCPLPVPGCTFLHIAIYIILIIMLH